MAAVAAPVVVGTGIATVAGSMRLVALSHLALTWFEQAWEVRTTAPTELAVTTSRLAGRLRVPAPVPLDADGTTRLERPALVIDLDEIDPIVVPGCPALRVPGDASLVRFAALACALVAGGP